MPARRWSAQRLLDDVVVLGREGLPRDRYFAEVAARLRRVIDFDAACWHTLDPETRLMTSDAPHELLEEGVFTPESVAAAGAAIVASEYLLPDANSFASLAARRMPVGILSQATRGRPERSMRYRELLVPAGIPHELRAAFVTRGRVWGAVHIARRGDRADFAAADAAVLARLTGAVAEGIRTSLRFDAARDGGDATAPGMVVLGPHDEVELITPAAHEPLAAMRSGPGDAPPAALLVLASHTRRHGPRAIAVPTAAGWVTLHASRADGAGDGRVAIVVERSATAEATAVRLETHGVTAREREIATLLARGLTNPEIADALVLSPYTVQDHIKSLFEKTGVSSRQELVARMFLDDYLPQLQSRTPLTTTGAFATPAPN